MSDYRNVIRLAREVEAIRSSVGSVTTPEEVDALAARVEVLHGEVAAALAAHAVTRPWYSRWLWAWRLRQFERRQGVTS